MIKNNLLFNDKLTNHFNKYNSIFDNLDEFIYIIDPETNKILYVNSYTEEIYKDCINKDCFEIIYGGNAKNSFRYNKPSIDENLEMTFHWEYYNEKLNSWFRCISKKIKWSNEQWVRFEIAIDISDFKNVEDEIINYYEKKLNDGIKLRTIELTTSNRALEVEVEERKFIENKLTISEKKYRQLVNLAQEGIIALDQNFNIVLVNPKMVVISGYSENELINLSLFHLFEENSLNIVKSNLENHKNGISGQYEVKIIRKDGQPVYVLVPGSPNYDIVTSELNGTIEVITNITDLKETAFALEDMIVKQTLMDEELIISEHTYRLLFQNLSVGVGISDGNTILFANNALINLFGYSDLDEFIKIPIMDTIAPNSKANMSDISNLINNSQLPLNEIIGDIVRKDGEIRTVHISFSEINIIDGLYRQSVFVDITEQKRNEYEKNIRFDILKISQSTTKLSEYLHQLLIYFKESLDIESVGIRIKKGDDYPYFETIGFSNEFVEKENYLCHLQSNGKVLKDESGNVILECICGNLLCNRFDPSKPYFTNNGSFWTNCITNSFSNEAELNSISRIRNRCNRVGYESITMIPFKISEGNLGLLQLNDRRKNRFTKELIVFLESLAITIAISCSQKIFIEKLNESEEKYRQLINLAQEGIISTTLEGNITFVNPKMASILEMTENELIGTSIFNFFDEENKDIIQYNLDKRKQSISSQYETMIVLKDGQCKYGLISGTPTYNIDTGKVNGTVAVVTNITEIVENKNILHETMTKLKNSNEELEQFAYVASHDLQEPLRMVSSFLLLLEKRYSDSLEQNAKEFIGFAVDGAKRMHDMINDLLAYSRIGTRGNSFELVDFDIPLHNAIGNLKNQLEETKANIIIHKLPSLYVDNIQITQLFQNLISNAVKFP